MQWRQRKQGGKGKKGGGSRASKFVFFVGDEGCILIHMQGKAVLKRLFAPNAEPASTRAFSELLAAAPRIPIYMLVDMIDQSYVRHDLPPVSALSIHRLVKRRLDRDFGREDLKGALPLGREKGGRKDWNYLLISLTKTPLLQKWIEFVTELPNPFRGIYLAPVEAQAYLKQLADMVENEQGREPTRWRLLVSHNKVGGFRQVVLKNGKLIFTRMAQPLGETIPEVVAGNIEQEVQSTIEYLKRLSYDEQGGLALYIIVSQEIKQAIDKQKFKATHVEIFTPHEVTTRFGFVNAALPSDHFGDVLLAAHFGYQRKRLLVLTTPYVRKLQALYQANMAASALTWLGVAGLVLYSGNMMWEMVMANRDMATLERDRTVAQQNLARVKEETKTLPADMDRITDVVSVYETFSSEDRVPLTFIADMQRALAGERIRVKSLVWTTSNEFKKADGTPSDLKVVMNLEFLENTGDVDRFVKTVNAFLDKMRGVFTGFEVVSSTIPGTYSDNQVLQLTFDKNVQVQDNVFIEGKPILLEVTLTMKADTKTPPTNGQPPATP